MRKVGNKILYTRKEVEQLIHKNPNKKPIMGDVCKFYMSYDNNPNIFEERWGVAWEEEPDKVSILLLEGTDINNSANYPYCEMIGSKYEGFEKPTKIRLDQAIIVSYSYITSIRGKLLKKDLNSLKSELKKGILSKRYN